MTLSFSQQINGAPNYFIQQIWNSILLDDKLREEHGKTVGKFMIAYDDLFNPHPKIPMGWDHKEGDCQQKRHTIRIDSTNRWKVGMKIHPIINNRKKNRFQFAPVLKVKSIQSIRIEDLGIETRIYIDDKYYSSWFHMPTFSPDTKMRILTKNDGFRSPFDFIKYFNHDFEGKIIHWTDHKY